MRRSAPEELCLVSGQRQTAASSTLQTYPHLCLPYLPATTSLLDPHTHAEQMIHCNWRSNDLFWGNRSKVVGSCSISLLGVRSTLIRNKIQFRLKRMEVIPQMQLLNTNNRQPVLKWKLVLLSPASGFILLLLFLFCATLCILFYYPNASVAIQYHDIIQFF